MSNNNKQTEMFSNINEIENKYGIKFILNSDDDKNVLSIFNGNTNENLYDMSDSNILNYLGLYYKLERKAYFDAKEYFIRAVYMNNSNAMHNLGLYYETHEKNIEEMKKYFLMAISLNNTYSMIALGHFYNTIGDTSNMEKYYKMAAELNVIDAMLFLGNFYNSQKKYDLMIKYYEMAAEFNNIKAIKILKSHYELTNKYDELNKLRFKMIKMNDKSTLNNIFNEIYYEYNDKEKLLTQKNIIINEYKEVLEKYKVILNKIKVHNEKSYNIFNEMDSENIELVTNYYCDTFDNPYNIIKEHIIDNLIKKNIEYNNINCIIKILKFCVKHKMTEKIIYISNVLINLKVLEGYYTLLTHYGSVNDYTKMEELLIQINNFKNSN
jgi:hypothetical protein